LLILGRLENVSSTGNIISVGIVISTGV